MSVSYTANAGDKYYFHEDHLGGASVVTDEGGGIVASYDYYPYGDSYFEEVYDENFSNNYKFTDQEEDTETGLYYYGARYYGGSIARFMSQDPAVYDERLFEMMSDPQSLNSYAYVRNNPIKYIDPSGELPKFMWKIWANHWDMQGNNIAADLLRISVEGDVDTKKFYNDSEMASVIRDSNEYQENIISGIQDNIDDGLMFGKFTGDDYVEFNGGDLGLALHGMTDGGWMAVEQQNGSYNIYIIMEDVYDFAYQDAKWYDFGVQGVNEAYKDQQEGDLSVYNIKIYMEDSYDPSAAEE